MPGQVSDFWGFEPATHAAVPATLPLSHTRKPIFRYSPMKCIQEIYNSLKSYARYWKCIQLVIKRIHNNEITWFIFFLLEYWLKLHWLISHSAIVFPSILLNFIYLVYFAFNFLLVLTRLFRVQSQRTVKTKPTVASKAMTINRKMTSNKLCW